MKSGIYRYDPKKNTLLKNSRGISFEEIIAAIAAEHVIQVIEHPNSQKYPPQQIYLVEVNKYIYAVPFIEEKDGGVLLKTIFPSRKFTKIYLSDVKEN